MSEGASCARMKVFQDGDLYCMYGGGDELLLGVSTQGGKRISGYHAADGVPIDGDDRNLPASWQTMAKLVDFDHSQV